MRRIAQIGRRSFATVGMLALALAYLPGVVCVLNVAPACCMGTICPMHNSSGSHMTCGMDMGHASAALHTCGCHSAQYTGGIVFDRVEPGAAGTERVTRAASVLIEIAFPSVSPEVTLPPPRFAVS